MDTCSKISSLFTSRIFNPGNHKVRVLVQRTKKSTIIRHAVAFSCVFLSVFISIYACTITSQHAPPPRNDVPPIEYQYIPSGFCDLGNSTDAEQIFAVNVRSGSLTYMQAKAIQICWDLVIGQGGRLLHAWLLFKGLSDACVFLLERYGVPHELYTSLAITSDSFGVIVSSARILTRRRNWEVIATAIWAILSMAHVLLFPVLWSGATGYLNPTKNYCQGPNLELVDCSLLRSCTTIIDGSRIGLQDNAVVAVEDFEDYMSKASVLVNDAEQATNYSFIDSTTFPQNFTEIFYPDSVMSISSSSGAELEDKSSGQHWDFDSSVSLDPGVVPYNSSIRLNDKIYNLSAPLLQFGLDNSSMWSQYYFYEATNVCYNSTMYSEHPKNYCVTDQGFVWGFSSTLVIVGLSFESCWALLLYIVWLNANSRSVLLKYGAHLQNLFANSADLVKVIQDNIGDDIDSRSVAQVRESLAKEVGDLCWVIRKGEDGKARHLSLVPRSSIRRKNSLKRLLADKTWDSDSTELFDLKTSQIKPQAQDDEADRT